MKVLSSSATRGYRKGVADLGAAARQLGVRYMLEGNVRRVGATLRVTCQLVEAETSNIVWTQKFDRPLAELAELQEDLVARGRNPPRSIARWECPLWVESGHWLPAGKRTLAVTADEPTIRTSAEGERDDPGGPQPTRAEVQALL
jgi:hypothetical protein